MDAVEVAVARAAHEEHAAFVGGRGVSGSPDALPDAQGERAYAAMRAGVFPWLREKRAALERRRAEMARANAVVAAGRRASYAITKDDTLVCWGSGCGDGRVLKQEGVVAVAAGSEHVLALLRDGNIVCSGDNTYGQAPPEGVQGDFVAIAAGENHSLAVRRDGSICCFGSNDEGQAPPEGVDGDYVACAAGHGHSLALRRDGTVACWGSNAEGAAPPEGVDGDFVAVAAGMAHSLALRRRDGGVTAWGRNREGAAPPAGVDGEFVAIAAGGGHSLALRKGGGIVAWGWNKFGRWHLSRPPACGPARGCCVPLTLAPPPARFAAQRPLRRACPATSSRSPRVATALFRRSAAGAGSRAAGTASPCSAALNARWCASAATSTGSARPQATRRRAPTWRCPPRRPRVPRGWGPPVGRGGPPGRPPYFPHFRLIHLFVHWFVPWRRRCAVALRCPARRGVGSRPWCALCHVRET